MTSRAAVHQIEGASPRRGGSTEGRTARHDALRQELARRRRQCSELPLSCALVCPPADPLRHDDSVPLPEQLECFGREHRSYRYDPARCRLAQSSKATANRSRGHDITLRMREQEHGVRGGRVQRLGKQLPVGWRKHVDDACTLEALVDRDFHSGGSMGVPGHVHHRRHQSAAVRPAAFAALIRVSSSSSDNASAQSVASSSRTDCAPPVGVHTTGTGRPSCSRRSSSASAAALPPSPAYACTQVHLVCSASVTSRWLSAMDVMRGTQAAARIPWRGMSITHGQ